MVSSGSVSKPGMVSVLENRGSARLYPENEDAGAMLEGIRLASMSSPPWEKIGTMFI